MKTKKQIREWLEAQPWYEQWLENWKEQYPTTRDQTIFWKSLDGWEKNLILISFQWYARKPSFDFWNDVNKKYIKWFRSK